MMEAKVTVMSPEERIKFDKRFTTGSVNLKGLAEAQAEISFKAGERDMVKEILELIDNLKNNEEAFVDDVDFRCPSYKDKPLYDIEGMYKKLEHSKQTYKKIGEAIQAFLKEKGIEQNEGGGE